MIQTVGIRVLSLLALVGLGLAGCSTPRQDAEYRAELDQAEQALAAGQYQRTIEPMRELLAQSAEEPEVYELQRFFAQALIAQATIEAGFDQPEAQSGCPIAFTYTQAEVRHLLRANDFLATEITQDHIFPYVVEKYVQYDYELQPWFAAMPREMFRALERRFGWHMLIVAKPA